MSQPIHGNPLVRFLAAIGAVLLTAVAVFVGALAFLGLFGLAIIAFLIFQVRLWMIRRRIAAARRKQGAGHEDSSNASIRRAQGRPGRVIEGEFHESDPDRKD